MAHNCANFGRPGTKFSWNFFLPNYSCKLKNIVGTVLSREVHVKGGECAWKIVKIIIRSVAHTGSYSGHSGMSF